MVTLGFRTIGMCDYRYDVRVLKVQKANDNSDKINGQANFLACVDVA